MQIIHMLRHAILLNVFALTIGGCGNQTYAGEGYLVQSGDFGVFSSNSQFSPAYNIVTEGGSYAEFENKSLNALRGPDCHVKMYHVELYGKIDQDRSEIAATRFTVLKEIPTKEAGSIAKMSKNTVVGSMEFC